MEIKQKKKGEVKMPIVKSIAIHDNVKATLKYILDPEKTEGLFLCNSLNCFTNAEDAYLNMNYCDTRVVPPRFCEGHEDRIFQRILQKGFYYCRSARNADNHAE